ATTAIAELIAREPLGPRSRPAATDPAVEMLAQLLSGAVQSLALWWQDHPDIPRERLVEAVMDFCWVGLERLRDREREEARRRLGHGIVQIPPPFNHPARVAERIATLDLVSGGRVDFGTGESSSQAELGAFGVDRMTKREQWDEALDAITRMFVEEPFAGYEGEFFSMPPRNVIPKPKQKPHPPVWVACSRRETILLAARKGIGALSFSFIEPEAAKEWADEYYAILESDECVPAGFEWNPNLAVVLPMMLDKNEAKAIEKGIDGAHFFGYSLAHYYAFGEHVPGRTNVWEQF